MYSSVNNREKHNSILSFKEILGIIIVFSFMLYLLFPKGNIEDFLDAKGKHANLSIHYLKSMVLYHPKNIELKMILMEKYTQTGKEEDALTINQELIENTNKRPLLIQLYKVEYLLQKALYLKNANSEKLQQLKDKLLDYYKYTKENRDYLFFFAESSNIDYRFLKYHSLRHFMEESPEIVDYELEKMAYDLATQLGYRDEAYLYLQKLIKYPELDNALSEHLIYSLFERGDFSKARKITTEFFLKSETEDERTKFFHLALHALVQDQSKSPTDVSQLIQDYANLKELLTPDIIIILSTLLELGDSKEAANFAVNMFYSNPQHFDETGIDLALKSFLYNSHLEHAREFSYFAEAKFKKEKYLDQTIQLSTWLSDSKAVGALNTKGYYEYNSTKYEQYFLSNENLDLYYETLAHIYKKKVTQKNYTFIDKVASYYEYTGKLVEAEKYFEQLHQQTKHQKANYYAIEFSHKNSHFEKALALYEPYKAKHGIDSKLHELAIKGLIALKRFDEAYAMTKAVEAKKFLGNKRRFTDLAWLEKDYTYLHQKYWDFEANKELAATDFEHFLLLEKELGQGDKINHLYKLAWRKTHKSYHLATLMYQLLQAKKLEAFQQTLNALNKKEKNILENNVDLQVLLAAYHVQNNNIELALKSYKKIFQLAPHKVSSHQSYLWFLMDNQEKHPELSKEVARQVEYLKAHPQLREQLGIVTVIAAISSKKEKLAKRWVQQLLRKNPLNKEYQRLAKEVQSIEHAKLYSHYEKLLNPEHLHAQVNLKTKEQGAGFKVHEADFSYQWKLYQNIKAKVMLKHYEYRHTKAKNLNDRKAQQTSLELALKKSDEAFLWDLSLAQTMANKDFSSASLNLGYRTHNFNVNLNTKYQNKTTLTPLLEQNAVENALALNIRAYINQRTSFSFLAQKSAFETLNGDDAGNAQKIQINANYVLRAGYPDISFNSYLSHNQFSKTISRDFSEFGIASSIGTSRQQTLNSSWKPFASVAFAINDQQNLGGSLSFGVSKMLAGDDSLDFLFDYYKGIGVISEPIYGVNVKYRF